MFLHKATPGLTWWWIPIPRTHLRVYWNNNKSMPNIHLPSTPSDNYHLQCVLVDLFEAGMLRGLAIGAFAWHKTLWVSHPFGWCVDLYCRCVQVSLGPVGLRCQLRLWKVDDQWPIMSRQTTEGLGEDGNQSRRSQAERQPCRHMFGERIRSDLRSCSLRYVHQLFL